MKYLKHISSFRKCGKFRKDEDGAILVEFALVLPIMLLMMAVAIESGRVYWSYQRAVSGVRDAGRYLARITPIDICLSGGSVAGYATTLKGIVENDIGGAAIMPSNVTINSVTPSVACVAGTYRTDPAPVATVSASLTITFPFSGALGFFGVNLAPTTMTIADQSRIYGQ